MKINILKAVETHLPDHLSGVIERAAGLAERKNHHLYLVGGLVRDTLLNLPNSDVDLVFEGDAVELGRELANSVGGSLTIHEKFHTAKLKIGSHHIDLATVRAETYARPGALPTVHAGTLKDDLFRRDFTINALAIRLTGPHKGELIDYFDGQQDLKNKVIRVLHDKSFIDDATRIWRAVRYEQRLAFLIEPVTLILLKKGVTYLSTVSGDRIRHELELVLKEKTPEKILQRASGLKILSQIHPALKADARLGREFKAARAFDGHLHEVYYALLAHHLNVKELEDFIAYLKPAKKITETLRDSVKLKNICELDDENLLQSTVFHLLKGYSIPSVITNAIATPSSNIRENSKLYYEELRHAKPILTGDDLMQMGISKGIEIKKLLKIILDARLEGKVKSRHDEEKLVREYLIA
ncbi:MAG TPA: CCA tRNA nucleotidyltransferase [Dehalococcoidales bacterium]|nr:CCA tRNA nucleotidyltransferase [Dehalococcoidales bacterium]